MVFFFKRRKPKELSPQEIKRLSKAEREALENDLKARGGKAWEVGRAEEALTIYRQLVVIDAKEAEYRRRLADCHQKLHRREEEFRARIAAATLYAENGFLLKGIAMCKMALALAPEHTETQKRLAELNRLAGKEPEPQPSSASPGSSSGPGAANTMVPSDEERKVALAEARARVAKIRALRERQMAIRPIAENQAPVQPAPAHREESGSSGQALSAAPLKDALAHSVRSFRRGAPQTNIASAALEEGQVEEIFILPLDDDELKAPESEAAAFGLSGAPTGEALSTPYALARIEEERDAVAAAMGRTPLLGDLNEETFIRLIETVTRKTIVAGEVLFEAGSIADAMYVIVQGEVVARTKGPIGLDLATLREGDFFGEIGLLADEPRQASIVATKDTELLVFGRELMATLEETEPDFVRILLRFVRERLVASLITTNPLFSHFSVQDANELAHRFQFLEVAPNKALVRQGETSSGIFILLTGRAKVAQSQEGTSHTLGHLGPGDIFGEMSLLNRQPAVASVVTAVRSYALKLPAKDFTQLVMMHPALLDYLSTLAIKREKKNLDSEHPPADYREDWVPLL